VLQQKGHRWCLAAFRLASGWVKGDSGGGGGGSGHLNYLNHVTGVHLDCEVEFVTELTTITASAGSLGLILNAVALPTATVTAGSITLK